MGRVARGIRRSEDGILPGVEAAAARDFPPSGRTCGRPRDTQRSATICGKYGGDGPAAEQMPGKSVLTSEVRRLIEKGQVVKESVVVGLRAVAIAEVKGIGHTEGAIGLRGVARSHRAAPGKVRANRQTMIVLTGQRNDRGVVVAPAKTGFHEEAISLLLA